MLFISPPVLYLNPWMMGGQLFSYAFCALSLAQNSLKDLKTRYIRKACS